MRYYGYILDLKKFTSQGDDRQWLFVSETETFNMIETSRASVFDSNAVLVGSNADMNKFTRDNNPKPNKIFNPTFE